MINLVIFLLCLKIFCARILDVSIGTVRMILTVRNKSLYAAIVAFFEVFIWFMVAREALNTDINSFFIPISYSLGYATGTFIGGIISDKFIDSILGVQVITTKNSELMVNEIRERGFAVSIIPLKEEKDHDKKDMLFIQLHKSKLNKLTKVLNKLDPKAFTVVNETKTVQNGFIK